MLKPVVVNVMRVAPERFDTMLHQGLNHANNNHIVTAYINLALYLGTYTVTQQHHGLKESFSSPLQALRHPAAIYECIV